MNNESLINENAKNDWLKLVDRHKKRQKGMPALSTLNTDAGNVEHNIAMFNKMQGAEAPSVNPVNGTAMAEEVAKEVPEMVVLEYHNLPIDIETSVDGSAGYFDNYSGGWLDARRTASEGLVDWDLKVEKQDVLEVLGDNEFVQGEYWLDNMSPEEFGQFVEDNFIELLHRYIRDVKDHFYDAAREAAEEYYNMLDEDYNVKEEQITKNLNNLDDKFDMSMRTLI